MLRRRVRNASIGLALLAIALASTLAKRGDLSVELRFTPTTSTGEATPVVAGSATSRTVRFEVKDERAETDPAVIGQGTDDDDSVFAVKATNPFADFATTTLTHLATGWGIRVDSSGDAAVIVVVAKWWVAEEKKPVGAMYVANVTLRGEVRDRSGATLWQGVVNGDTRRYGKKQRPENYNEVMSDAAQEALANLISEPGLQAAIEGKQPAATLAPAESESESDAHEVVSPNRLLEDLAQFVKNGFSNEFLVSYVKRRTINPAMMVDDIVKWKKAGLAEDVIAAAEERGGGGR